MHFLLGSVLISHIFLWSSLSQHPVVLQTPTAYYFPFILFCYVLMLCRYGFDQIFISISLCVGGLQEIWLEVSQFNYYISKFFVNIIIRLQVCINQDSQVFGPILTIYIVS